MITIETNVTKTAKQRDNLKQTSTIGGYRHVPTQRVWLLRRFCPKTDIDFAHFGLESGMVFEETTGVYERICCFNSK